MPASCGFQRDSYCGCCLRIVTTRVTEPGATDGSRSNAIAPMTMCPRGSRPVLVPLRGGRELWFRKSFESLEILLHNFIGNNILDIPSPKGDHVDASPL